MFKRKIKEHEYIIVFNDVGIFKEISNLILDYLDICYCSKHELFFPQTLKMCLLCFDAHQSTDAHESMYYCPYGEIQGINSCHPQFHDEDILFQKHFQLFVKLKNPIKIGRVDCNDGYFSFCFVYSRRMGIQSSLLHIEKMPTKNYLYDCR
jgi:hypothetical protein